ncbi:MAG: alpha-amylase family glycosyl hydrolase [Muribaculaceae bacterium]
MIKRFITNILLGTIAAFCALPALSGTFVGERSDFRDETVYFTITTRFYDGDPKNNVLCWDNKDEQIRTSDPCWRGDFKGLIEKLDYIKALGFTAIWITPVVQNASGYDYHGYHAMDFSKVDLRYESHINQGSEEDVTFQSLIDAAHAKGMKIILDIVLNHTSNFGEEHLCKLFTRNNKICNQASVTASMIPEMSKLGADYNDVTAPTQHNRRLSWLKNVNGENLDTHNYWHHLGTIWNWDEPSRWWGQIAGDCVDLNTENPAVSDYLVKCYGKFIEMGVDGFRIDTTGHISRLTFNTSFIPQFLELGEQYKSKRLNECPFYMFGECCSRYSEVTYRGQPNLSSYFYTWQSPGNILDNWDYDASWWDNQEIFESTPPMGNMELCLEEPSEKKTSNNVFMENGAWHEPDYSEASGFNIIDFPMHYNFNNASNAIRIAKDGDSYYNDATYNLVYVDSHDYSPQPNEAVRFNGGTEQWAENLSLMFTFRGIPCIYYGSEVEFQKGKKIDNGPNGPLSDTGRAYFGQYLEGDVTASDFGEYSASGNVATTLNGDLSQHIRRLNLIRAAVPALRKGQYTFDGCSASGGYAFKRAYKDSYALVALNGGATFSDVPTGNYVDIVTGESYSSTNGTITVSSPSNKGQLRVLVKDWTGGKVGEDGQFIYTSTPVAKGGDVTFTDAGASFWYGPDDAVPIPMVELSPNGGKFKTNVLTVIATLNEIATEGWVKVGDGAIQTLTPGNSANITIGDDMAYGESIELTWEAKGDDQTTTGSATYTKVDPNASFTIYVTSTTGTAPYFYAWYTDESGTVQLNGGWPGKQLEESVEIDGRKFYYFTVYDIESVNFIFNNGSGSQTPDIMNVTQDSYYEWNGSGGYTQLYDVEYVDGPEVKVTPRGGNFVGTIDVTLAANSITTSAWYKIGDNSDAIDFTSTATFTLGADMADGESVTVYWGASNAEETKTGQVTFTKTAAPTEPVIRIFFDNTESDWSKVNAYIYPTECLGAWPGTAMTLDSETGLYTLTFTTTEDPSTLFVIFNNGSGSQSGDNITIRHNGIYDLMGDTGTTGVERLQIDRGNQPVEIYNLQGIRVENPQHGGIYIVKQGSKSALRRL